MTATCTLPVVSNHLLNYLPRLEYQWFVENCTPVELLFGETLNIADEAIKYVYFPVTGCISLLIEVVEKQSFAMELIGNEGMLGATLALENSNAAMKSIVQSSGRALRMDAAKFNHRLESNPLVRKLILNYLYVVMQQLAQTGACNNAHEVKQRLARWLLMTQDRTHSDHQQLTHQLLAKMLGVRRSAVTIAAGYLQQQGIISYNRGQISILSRAGLEQSSCQCYFAAVNSYQKTSAIYK
ncbi:Crp/Fnr family transcriptional regulator [Pseudoalteromonas sp. SR41-8]|uniref:Crp/Fnr family transcriptional regulator n=1 Tax=Pseudoalteromonas sp. SR41-8 TaxID=2760946 RepID=UPI0015FEFC9E|nr:Crp/Fnr family transcriptional regulator [Pseudoalteromonas sp. SR41-8]MBB1309480.1 Crp/Fnr family transcriptional regulator [Pseudoalteromonas sp. SR41-8]